VMTLTQTASTRMTSMIMSRTTMSTMTTSSPPSCHGHLPSLRRKGASPLLLWRASSPCRTPPPTPSSMEEEFHKIRLSGSSTASHRLQHINLDTTGSLQRQTTRESDTPYQITPPPHSWLMRRGHQPKKELYSEMKHIGPLLVTTVEDGQDLPTHPIRSLWILLTTRHITTPSTGTPKGIPVPNKHHSNRALGRPHRLRPGMIGHNHRQPCASNREALEYWLLTHQSVA
jgi:hypothetical protein